MSTLFRRGQAGSYHLNKLLSKRLPSVASAAPVNAVAATRVLTMDTQPTANDTITIGAKTYTFVASGADADGEINRGAGLADAKTNLVAAINGTDSINTAHPDVTAAAFSGNTMTITAKVKGAAANAIATTETFAAGTNIWAGVTMAGGVNGTVGEAWEQRWHSGSLYIAASDGGNPVSGANWYRQTFTLVT